MEKLGHGAGEVHHGELALPRLADPALAGKLLEVSRTFAFRVVDVKGGPDISGKAAGDENHEEEEKQQRLDASTRFAGWGLRCCGHGRGLLGRGRCTLEAESFHRMAGEVTGQAAGVAI